VFVERKPRDERFAWIKDALARKQNESFAANLLQIWLVSRRPKMLCDFLDALGIQHDENGTVENIPAQPEKSVLDAAVAGLLEKYDSPMVAIYLNAFQALDDTGWPLLEEIINADSRLRLGEPAAAPAQQS